jgi:hypothetical protein
VGASLQGVTALSLWRRVVGGSHGITTARLISSTPSHRSGDPPAGSSNRNGKSEDSNHPANSGSRSDSQGGVVGGDGNQQKRVWRSWMDNRLNEMEAVGAKQASADVPEQVSTQRRLPVARDSETLPIALEGEDPLADVVRGYSQLGSVTRSGHVPPPAPPVPADEEEGAEGAGFQGADAPEIPPAALPPRISPFRLFYPGTPPHPAQRSLG